jgi:VWFA-related protein
VACKASSLRQGAPRRRHCLPRPAGLARPAGPVGIVGLALAALLLPGSLAATDAPAAPAFSDLTEVTAIEIPVQVTRDGEPVRGLTVNDFDVFEGKTKQAITGFDVIDLLAPAARGLSANVPVAARRHFLLLFDLAFSEPKSILKARAAARDVMLKELVPSDLVAVATYASSSGPRLVLNFTSDRRQLQAAIDHLGLTQLVDRSPDPLRLVADDFKAAMPSDMIPTKAVAKVPASQMMAEYLEQAARDSERAERTDQMQVVAAMTSSLADLARLMAAVDGRKEVVYLSEGFNSSFLEGAESTAQQDKMAESTQFGQSYAVDSDARFGSTHQNNLLEKMLEAFRRSDCVIQAVDIGGLHDGDGDPANAASDPLSSSVAGAATRVSGEATLFQMAKDTGGELFRSFNDLGAAMDRLLKQTSLTYLLTIQPRELAHDGGYHKLRVQLRNVSRALQVSYRAGYYAPLPYGKLSPAARNLAAASALMGAQSSGSIDLAVLAAPFRGSAARAYVPVLIEAGGPALLAGTEESLIPTEIYVYAVTAQGQIEDYFDQAVRLDVVHAPRALWDTGLKFYGHLELPAGNGITGAYGMQAAELAVPAFAAATPVLLPPFLAEPPGRWMMLREPPRGEQKAAAYPFVAGDQEFIPASRPVLLPGQETDVTLVGYNWGQEEPQAEGRLAAADGRDLGPLALRLAGRRTGLGDRPDSVRATFRLPPGLAAGEYRLVITLSPAAGNLATAANAANVSNAANASNAAKAANAASASAANGAPAPPTNSLGFTVAATPKGAGSAR